jgi:CDP-paratose 2-epimerase
MPLAIVTGSGGLVGSESVAHLVETGFDVVGVENDMRAYFFGPSASTKPQTQRLLESYPEAFRSHELEIRDAEAIDGLFAEHAQDLELVIHTAAQPSHDWAASEPQTDFTINANGTLNLLEATRRHKPDATFIFASTNKVYGDRSLHSLFGASKAAADLLVQEYGRYFEIPTVCFRGGCLTGPNHAGARLHGFLSYLMRCTVTGEHYTVYGYDGKQVRDNIHSADLVRAFVTFHRQPRGAAVYNMGGGRESNCSMLEAISMCEQIAGRELDWDLGDAPRVGDHRWWISDLDEFRRDYPEWGLTYGIEEILREIHEQNVESWSVVV